MILEAKNLTKRFQNGRVTAVDDVSLSIPRSSTVGVVGESGSGKSTLARLLMRLIPADDGEIVFAGRELGVIFQDPFLSLDPRMSVGECLAEPTQIQKKWDRSLSRGKIIKLLGGVGLPAEIMSRAPHELSGGECQRVCIARALATEPDLIVCDEPVSSLDALVQAEILNLFLKIQRERRVSYLFISHDMRVIRHMSDTILVMKDGRILEEGARDELFQNPKHPYTQLLIHKAFSL